MSVHLAALFSSSPIFHEAAAAAGVFFIIIIYNYNNIGYSFIIYSKKIKEKGKGKLKMGQAQSEVAPSDTADQMEPHFSSSPSMDSLLAGMLPAYLPIPFSLFL
jgi:hypothetical protein